MRHALGWLVGSALTAIAVAQSTERVSVDSNGAEGDRLSWGVSMTPDGRFVLFTSDASNFGAPVGLRLTYIRDRTNGTTSLVSTATSAAIPDLAALGLGISDDGRYVLFRSPATNLGADGVVLADDLFVRDRQMNITSIVDVDSSGIVANASTGVGVISGNGRFVAFSTAASNLVPGDTNGTGDVFVRDLQSGATTRVSVDSTGSQANDVSENPAISADGRFVAFASRASNLVAGDTNGKFDIFVHDRQTGQTTRVSVDETGAQATGGDSRSCWISSNGQRVAFLSGAVLASTDHAGADLYLRDRQTARTILLSLTSSGLPVRTVTGGAISPDGEYVVFADHDELVPNDTNGTWDVYVHEVATGRTTRESVASNGDQGNGSSGFPMVFAVTARLLLFTSQASNLVPGDTNMDYDVFVRDRGPGRITPFCAGDGSLIDCPCGNNGTARRGCATTLSPMFSFGARGAYLGGYGTPAVSADTFLLHVEQATGPATIFYQCDATQAPAILDDGISCAGGSILRLATKHNVAYSAQYPQPGDLPVSMKGLIPAGGGTRYYQAWYRHDNPAYCPPASTNRTNGLIVVWAP